MHSGYRLNHGAVAGEMRNKWRALSDEDKNRFAPLCPEFVVEIRPKTDNIADLKKKMQAWIRNGVQLAWLVDPNTTSNVHL